MGSLCKSAMTKKGNFAFNSHLLLWGGMEWIEGVLTPPLHQFSHQTTSASPGSASALPGDIAGDWACSHAWFRSRPPPGSPLRLPGKFQVILVSTSRRNAGVACLF